MADFSQPLNDSIENKLEFLKNSYGLNQVEIGPLRSPLSIDFYEKWLSRNYHGTMSYLHDHLPFKKEPKNLNPQIMSVISVAQSYFPAPEPSALNVPARAATYASNDDYHFWLKEKLKKIIEDLKTAYPDSVFLPYVDSGPILERDLAYQNGLGWFGKNTCLIHPDHGSLFFIAEILTDLSSAAVIQPLPDFCGKCTKCMDICPTGAIVEPKVLRAEHCISYLTIESKEVPAAELRPKIGDWFFGCDLCQTICPWNEKVFRQKKIEKSDATSTSLILNLSQDKRNDLIGYFRFLLTESNKQIQKKHFGSPLLRAGAKGLKRNALIVIANQNLYELKTEVQNLKDEPLQELADWTLSQLKE
ncbi:MAG: iron-sulfur cluster-binding protein [Pseudobdellovibrio sp.]|jgi:epoxyqueuosine reductase|nr:iron-sulfur cluster-binding protein [Pseudobdellovibrio sp.]